jgi:hypothetical protein
MTEQKSSPPETVPQGDSTGRDGSSARRARTTG